MFARIRGNVHCDGIERHISASSRDSKTTQNIKSDHMEGQYFEAVDDFIYELQAHSLGCLTLVSARKGKV
jgi:hypothetical protein